VDRWRSQNLLGESIHLTLTVVTRLLGRKHGSDGCLGASIGSGPPVVSKPAAIQAGRILNLRWRSGGWKRGRRG
jgi:hypothetical protein